MVDCRFRTNQIGRAGSLRVGGGAKSTMTTDSATSACSHDEIGSESRTILQAA